MMLIYAVRFLTIIPIPFRQDEKMDDVARSALFYPLVGLGIGGLLFAAARLFSCFFPPFAAAALLLTLWTAITGGLHLDGLSDLVDGLGGGRSREDRLRIMKDSRVGAFGAISLVLFLLLKWSMLAVLLDSPAVSPATAPVLLLAPAAARLAALLAIWFFPPARPDGMGAFFKQHISWKEPLSGVVFTAVLGWALFGLPGLAAVLLAPALLLLYGLRVSRLLGGLTGDVYGALIELAELLLLTAAAAFLV